MAGRESENSINPKTATPLNQPMEWRKEKLVGDIRKSWLGQPERICAALKTPSPTPSNTGSLRSLQWDTDNETQKFCSTEKFYSEEVQMSAYEQPKLHERVTRDGTYGQCNAPLRGCVGLLLIFNSMHNTARDLRWQRLHLKHRHLKK